MSFNTCLRKGCWLLKLGTDKKLLSIANSTEYTEMGPLVPLNEIFLKVRAKKSIPSQLKSKKVGLAASINFNHDFKGTFRSN